MALVIQAATFLHQYANATLHTIPSKNPNALRLGVLSSAQINPASGLYSDLKGLSMIVWKLTV